MNLNKGIGKRFCGYKIIRFHELLISYLGPRINSFLPPNVFIRMCFYRKKLLHFSFIELFTYLIFVNKVVYDDYDIFEWDPLCTSILYTTYYTVPYFCFSSGKTQKLSLDDLKTIFGITRWKQRRNEFPFSNGSLELVRDSVVSDNVGLFSLLTYFSNISKAHQFTVCWTLDLSVTDPVPYSRKIPRHKIKFTNNLNKQILKFCVH